MQGFQIFPALCDCPGKAPAWGCILQTIQNLMTFFVGLGSIVIALFIALAGFTYMTSGGSPEKRQLANKRMLNAVIGLLILLCAYLLVDSIMKQIYNSNSSFGPWNTILAQNAGPDQYCLAKHDPPAGPPALFGAGSENNGKGGNGSPTPAGSSSSATGSSGLNVSAAVNWLSSNVHNGPPGNGICLTDVQAALKAGGVNLQCGAPPGHSGYAGYCNSSLQSLNFISLGSSDTSPQPGDIIVIQHSAGTKIGHIAMWTGSAWVSDFVQSGSESPPGNPYGSDGYNPQYWRP